MAVRSGRVVGVRAGCALAAVVFVVAGAPASAAVEPLRPAQYGLDRIHAERAWTRARGLGVVIAVLDTGVDLQHEDLLPKLTGGRDFVDDDDVPQDANGHGTHVAGIAAAASDNGRGIAGTAPAALVMPVRVLDDEGTGVESNVVAGIDFAVERAATLSMRLVVNLSLTDLQGGTGRASRRISDAVERAWDAGAVVVAAVGNEDLPFSEYPAAGANVIAVGATDDANRRSSFSNRRPTVVAPGERIVSSYWDPSTPGDHQVYAAGSGTSMAAPFVSGIAALLLSTGTSNAQAVERIVGTAQDLGAPGVDDDYGHGLVNAAAALGLAPEPPATPSAGPLAGVTRPAAQATFEAVQPSASQPATDAPAPSDPSPGAPAPPRAVASGRLRPPAPAKFGLGLVAAAFAAFALVAALDDARRSRGAPAAGTVPWERHTP